jgi:hypothetical protein
MTKYIELKNGKFIPENVVSAIGIDGGEICVEYTDGEEIMKGSVVTTEPCSIESVIVALRLRLAEKRE